MNLYRISSQIPLIVKKFAHQEFRYFVQQMSCLVCCSKRSRTLDCYLCKRIFIKVDIEKRKQFDFFYWTDTNVFNLIFFTGDSSEQYKLKLSVLGVNSQDDGKYICHVQLGANYLEKKRILQSSKSIAFPKRE